MEDTLHCNVCNFTGIMQKHNESIVHKNKVLANKYARELAINII